MDAAFYTIIVSLIGAKLILFVSNFSYYMSYPKELFSLARSGGVFQGGLTFGVDLRPVVFPPQEDPDLEDGRPHRPGPGPGPRLRPDRLLQRRLLLRQRMRRPLGRRLQERIRLAADRAST